MGLLCVDDILKFTVKVNIERMPSMFEGLSDLLFHHRYKKQKREIRSGSKPANPLCREDIYFQSDILLLNNYGKLDSVSEVLDRSGEE